jgi:MFS family permease
VSEDERTDRSDSVSVREIPYLPAFALGRVAATMGAQFISVAVGWELYERTGDPWALGLVGLAQVAPAMVLMLPAGNVADRFRRRNIAILSHVLLMIAALGLALVSWLSAPVEWVYALLVLSGVGRVFSAPATTTLLAQLLPTRQFTAAFPWLVSSGHLASITGPAIGGLLIATSGGAGTSYVAAMVGHLIFIGALATLPAVAPPASGSGRSVGDLFAGIGLIRRSQVFLAAISLDLFAVLLGSVVMLLPVFAKDILMVGPDGLGLLRSSMSIGALLSALLVTRLRPWERPGRVLLWTVAGFGLVTVVFGLSRNFALSMACLFLAGAFDSVSMVIRGTLQQVITPDRLRGRVAAVNSLFISMSNELGGFRAGAMAALVGPIISVVGGGIGTLAVVGAVALFWPQLARIGPLHTLRPVDEGTVEPTTEKVPTRSARV